MNSIQRAWRACILAPCLDGNNKVSSKIAKFHNFSELFYSARFKQHGPINYLEPLSTETPMSIPDFIYQRKSVLVALAMLSLVAIAPPEALAQTNTERPVPLVEMSETVRTKMAHEIVAIANRIANERNYFEEEVRPVTITGAFNVESNVFHFDMEERFGPDAGYDELADMHRAIEIAIEPLTDRVDKLYSIYWTYGGKDIENWMPRPGGAQPAVKGTTAIDSTGAAAGASKSSAVVAAGLPAKHARAQAVLRQHVAGG